MSKKCKNCGAELPEEANFCLECMTVFDNLTDKNEIAVTDGSGKSALLAAFEKCKEKLLTLTKKQRAALISAFALFLLLVPLSIFLFSPVEPSGNITGVSANGSMGDDKPVTRVEALFDEVFGTEDENGNDSNIEESVSGGAAENNAASNRANGNSQKAENGKNSSTTDARPGSGGTTSNTTVSGLESNANSSNSAAASSAPVLNYADWKYETGDDGIVITRYTGKDKNIVVPDKIDGKNVRRIRSGTFKDNDTIETVTFKDSEEYHGLWIEDLIFENCDSLKKIIFPENTNLGIYEEFFLNCPKLAELKINFNQFRYIEGALYSYNGAKWSLRAYCEGYTAATYTVPAWCTSISSASRNLSNNRYLKTINIHENCYAMSKQWNYYEYKYLENINVDKANPYYYSESGVLYSVNDGALTVSVYPAGKKDKTFNLAESSTLNCYGMKKGLFTNVETITVPATSKIQQDTLEDIQYYFPNIKNIKVEKRHPEFKNYKNTLDKFVNVVEY